MQIDIETGYEGLYASRPSGTRINEFMVILGMLVIYQVAVDH